MKPINALYYRLIWLFLILNFSSSGLLSAQDISLDEGFKRLESARPRTWWHWTNSNVTKEGITKDLEWMKRVAKIGGMQLADVLRSGTDCRKEAVVFFS